MSLVSCLCGENVSILNVEARPVWRFCNAGISSQLTISEVWKDSGFGNWSLQWMERLNHRLPQGELTLALLVKGGDLGQGQSLASL